MNWIIVPILAQLWQVIYQESNCYMHKAIPRFVNMIWVVCVIFVVVDTIFDKVIPLIIELVTRL